jgi:hypothetical protein
VIFDELEEQQQQKQLQVKEEKEIEFPAFSASPIGEIDEIENLFTTVW